MTTVGKTRIYDLARNLSADTLSEKDRKNLQTSLTKQIIELCKEFGEINKTASSSIDNSLIAKIKPLLKIEDNLPKSKNTDSLKSNLGQNAKSQKPKPPTSLIDQSKLSKSPRVLRRIEKTEDDEIEAEELEPEEFLHANNMNDHPEVGNDLEPVINNIAELPYIADEDLAIKPDEKSLEEKDKEKELDSKIADRIINTNNIQSNIEEPINKIVEENIKENIELASAVETKIEKDIKNIEENSKNLDNLKSNESNTFSAKPEPENETNSIITEEPKATFKFDRNAPISPVKITSQNSNRRNNNNNNNNSTAPRNIKRNNQANPEQNRFRSSNTEPDQRTSNSSQNGQLNNNINKPYQQRPTNNNTAATTTNTAGTSQPYRVAKPINSSLTAVRRKPAGNAPLANNQRRGPGNNRNASNDSSKGNNSANSRFGFGGNNSKPTKEQLSENRPTELKITRPVTVKELAVLMEINETEIIRNLFLKGIMRTVNQTLEMDLMIEVAEALGCKITAEQARSDQDEGLASRLKVLVDNQNIVSSSPTTLRPPVVTIMGHVDHGKTTLLDSIRKSKYSITASESGGITQHIGAYQIDVIDYDNKARKVTFLDTPGHEAFTALRARGAQVTDIAILVVAADDGVMPQTIEAIAHAKAAGVPIIVAVNKIDKPDANPDRVLTQLIEHELVVEDYGGSVVCAKISAKQNLNLDDLLTKITLVADAELQEKLLAHNESPALGAVIEAALSPSRGPVATLLVQNGTLKKGDSIAVGASSGRVRAIFNDLGKEILVAPPSTPVQILGLDNLPQAGDIFRVFKNAQEAKSSANEVKDSLANKRRVNKGLEYFSSQVREGKAKELAIVIKADMQGSAEAVASELSKLSSNEVVIRIIHCAAGAVTENDVNLASATNSIIVNFNSVVDSSSTKAAQENAVPIYNYNIIYQITDAVQKAINGLLEPERIDIKHGQAEIRQIFMAGKNKIAGCSVQSGKLVRGSMAKILRNKKELANIKLDNLKRFKDDAKEVLEGFECGLSFDGFNDLEIGDIIESWGFEMKERKD